MDPGPADGPDARKGLYDQQREGRAGRAEGSADRNGRGGVVKKSRVLPRGPAPLKPRRGEWALRCRIRESGLRIRGEEQGVHGGGGILIPGGHGVSVGPEGDGGI